MYVNFRNNKPKRIIQWYILCKMLLVGRGGGCGRWGKNIKWRFRGKEKREKIECIKTDLKALKLHFFFFVGDEFLNIFFVRPPKLYASG